MVLSINPPNLSGLAALASNNSNLNLPSVGGLGLQALQLRQNQENAARDDAYKQMALRQQGELALRQQGLAQQQLNMQQQQLGQQRQDALAQNLQAAQAQSGLAAMNQAQKDRDFALQVQKLALDQQNKDRDMAFKYQQQQMAQLLDQKKEDIHDKGAFASYARIAIDKVQTPEEANQLRSEIIKEGLSKGVISAEEAQLAAKMPLSQFKNSLEYKIMQYGAVKDFKDITKSGTPPGSTQVFDPQTGQLVYSQTPTQAATTETEKDLVAKEKALQNLASIRDNFNKNYFTYAGQSALGASKFAEKVAGVPGLSQGADLVAGQLTGKNEKEREKYIQDATKYANAVEQFFFDYQHQISGAAVSEKEVQRLKKSYMNGEMSPSEFRGALDQVLSKTIGEAEFDKNILRKGLDVSPGVDAAKLDATRQLYRSKGWSDDQINSALRSKGLIK